MKTLSELFKDKKLQDQIVVVNSLTPITVKENIKMKILRIIIKKRYWIDNF